MFKAVKLYLLFILLLLLNILAIASLISNNSESESEKGVFVITMIDSAENTNKTKNYTKKEKYFLHKGGEYLDPNILFDLVKSTIKNFEINLNNEANTILIYETLITETLGGQYPYSYACYNYKNYGIAQFRVETANFLKGFIKRVSKHDYNLLMSLRVQDKSEKWNLMYNVKYSIALCLIYYYQRDKNIASKAKYLEYRAQLWKTHYNTNKGLGEPEYYVERVQKYFKDHNLNL